MICTGAGNAGLARCARLVYSRPGDIERYPHTCKWNPMANNILCASSLPSTSNAQLAETLRGLTALLPVDLRDSLTIQTIDDPAWDTKLGVNFETAHALSKALCDSLTARYGHSRCIILVPNDHFASQLWLKCNPNALYGGVLGCTGFIYGNFAKQTLFHECLHLFGADDCYYHEGTTFHDRTCGNDNCLMQYNPPVVSLAGDAVLCETNKSAIQHHTMVGECKHCKESQASGHS